MPENHMKAWGTFSSSGASVRVNPSPPNSPPARAGSGQRVPVPPAGMSATSVRTNKTTPRHPRDVLMVTHDGDTAQALGLALNEDARTLDMVARASEGLAQLRRECYRLLLVDLTAHEFDGWQVLHTLRAQPALRPPAVLAICNSGSRSQVLGALTAGADDFIAGPYHLNDFAVRVDSWLRRVGANASHGAPGLRVYTLGDFRVECDGTPRLHKGSRARKAITLFKYLLTHEARVIPSAELAGLLWPDITEDVAATDLRSLLYQLRRSLGVVGRRTSFLEHAATTLTLRLGPDDWWDVREFTSWLAEAAHWRKAGDTDRALKAYSSALALYQGDFLEDDAYVDWAQPTRDQLHAEWVRALEVLVALHGERAEQEAQEEILRTLLRADPYRERTLRLLMELLVDQGRTAEALVLYRQLHMRVQTEFGATPDPETQALAARISQRAF